MINSRNSWHTAGNCSTGRLRKSAGRLIVDKILSVLFIISYISARKLFFFFFSFLALINRSKHNNTRCNYSKYRHKVYTTSCDNKITKHYPQEGKTHDVECRKFSPCHIFIAFRFNEVHYLILQLTNIVKISYTTTSLIDIFGVIFTIFIAKTIYTPTDSNTTTQFAQLTQPRTTKNQEFNYTKQHTKRVVI